MAPRKSSNKGKSRALSSKQHKQVKSGRVSRQEATTSTQNRGGPRSSDSKSVKLRKSRESEQSSQKKRKQKRKGGVDASQASVQAEQQDNSSGDDFPEPPTERSFTYLQAKTRRVPQEILMTQWKALPEAAQKRIRDILMVAKRSVVNTSKTSKRAEEMEASVEPLLRRISSRLGRMPAPPKAKERNFDLEKLLENGRILEAQLTAALHSVELLKAEIQREENRLQGDVEELSKLETNAKQEKVFWKRQAKKLDSSISLPSDDDVFEDSPEEIGLMNEELDNDGVFDEDDPDLAPLFSQLLSHLDSIRSSSRQVKGISDGLGRTLGALEKV